MTSSSESDLICPNCRQPVPARAMFCPSCGQLTLLASGSYPAGSEATSAGSGPLHVGQTFWQDTTVESLPPPPVPPVYGAAIMPAAADADMALHASPAKKQGPGRLLVSVSLALLVAIVLGIGGYTLYNVFAAHDESAAARVLPGNTYAYVSIDIVQYAVNSHNFSATDLFQSGGQAQNDPIKQATGLDWQTDILPWVDRDIAVAAFPRLALAGSANDFAPIDSAGAVILIQSKDDSAAQKAMKKAADFQGSRGNAISQSTFSGFTLYSENAGSGTTFTAGSGWAIIATDATTAQMVIDRVNGKGDTLNGETAYQNATSNLASDRFGTIFVNIKELYTTLTRTGSSANPLLPFANIYPTAGGFLEWTSAGLRAQVTLRATQNLGIGDLHGDTTSLASLVPQDAMLYAGIGNLGADALAAAKISAKLGNPGTSADPLQQYLGISSDSQALQQPAAVVVTGGTASATTSVAFLLKAPDPGAAEALMQQIASAHQLTIRPLTIAGETGMGVYSAGGSLTAAAAVVNGTLVVGSSTNIVAAIINTAHGGPSLAQQSDFQKLIQNAPSDASTSLFVNLSSVQSSLSNLSQDGSIGKLLAHTTALLLTGSTNDQESQSTLDLKVNI